MRVAGYTSRRYESSSPRELLVDLVRSLVPTSEQLAMGGSCQYHDLHILPFFNSHHSALCSVASLHQSVSAIRTYIWRFSLTHVSLYTGGQICRQEYSRL